MMNDPDNNALGWVIGALVVVTLIAVYLWYTAPVDSVLSETYTVM